MATSISNILFALPITQRKSTSRFNHSKLQLQATPLSPTTTTTTCNASQTQNNSSLSSTITRLEQQEVTKQKPNQPTVSDVWRKIPGEDNWAGLLDPMDPRMRSELIRYGDMTQACYDAFDFDPYSKYCGSCRFPIDKFFESLNLTHLGYTVTRYLYSTANVNLPNFFKKSRWPHKMWSKHANWAGYVAVSDDATTKRVGRRDITVSWRGTVTHVEWVADLMNFLKPISPDIPCPDKEVKVEAGFLDIYTDKVKDNSCGYCKYSAREQVLAEVKRLVEMYPNEELSVTITGHSLGSAMAILSAFDIVETGLNVTKDGRGVHVSVFSFSGPRVGNLRFKERLESKLGVKVLRVHNAHDMVAKSPGIFFNENSPAWVLKLMEGLPWCYMHVGVELELDHKKSPYLNPNGDGACAHNLEAHLHLLDGYHGRNREFEVTSGRDIALVNKDCDFLKDEHTVPPRWRQDLNKGMIMTEDGRWVLAERPKLVDHPEDIDHHLKQLGLASSDI
ncbi:phospholipase A1-Igamma1, chloroplastic-like [Gastrolobium bilobum]|uniref:phospholipase A1-Igamma1, chloroplastic-like n=1 Tax=Gastrolobium bilobum TaxID=150636 RepID=UPI002AB0EAEF|nr:phospholipase A1-Igamma1, chloroplastic-like [Gastrolobium bilobum]